MPIAKFHVHDGVFTDERLAALGAAVQSALREVLHVPADDLFQIYHTLPRGRFVHTPAFLGAHYSDEFVLLELTFIVSRPTEVRLALLRAINDGVVEATGISPDDLMITIYEVAGENISFGRGLAQRAHVSSAGTT